MEPRWPLYKPQATNDKEHYHFCVLSSKVVRKLSRRPPSNGGKVPCPRGTKRWQLGSNSKPLDSKARILTTAPTRLYVRKVHAISDAFLTLLTKMACLLLLRRMVTAMMLSDQGFNNWKPCRPRWLDKVMRSSVENIIILSICLCFVCVSLECVVRFVIFSSVCLCLCMFVSE